MKGKRIVTNLVTEGKLPCFDNSQNLKMNPDSAVEREVMSKDQTFRSEDNAFYL
jgi:hypothetical protein